MNIMLLLLVAAGISLVIQNLLMVRITESVSTVLITLVINSSVGESSETAKAVTLLI